MNNPTRVCYIIQGRVQGVGFRPFVWRLATEECLAGFCQNTSAGVRIEVQGLPDAIHRFEDRLAAELPPLAQITDLSKQNITALGEDKAFAIRNSCGHVGQNILVSPDVAICADCLSDLHDPANLRFGYPFTNCTNCGPRFSITASLPYDRPATTMSCFELCEYCASEYVNPANRRFHAQPVACATCGPEIWFVSGRAFKQGKTEADSHNRINALARIGAAIMRGEIIALRGLGGFQLVCDARNPGAVAALRIHKQRPHKALAIMVADIETVEEICEIDKLEKDLLTGQQKPIVLCKFKSGLAYSDWLSPDTTNLGIMLPYTPLHVLLFDWLKANGMDRPLLVMTSANPQSEPICLGNREALVRLAQIADGWLLHNRDILCRVDDSVVGKVGNSPMYLRRARGYVPEPLALPEAAPSVLGAGADLKAVFCLTRNAHAFMGQHIGDLESPACMDFYESALGHLQNLLETRPELVIHDLHPDFMSTQFGKNLADKAGIPAYALQHHVAHAASCLAENRVYEPALALCLDGAGYGVDRTIWGGELLFVDLSRPSWQRLGRLAPFPLPGGDMASREPWRIAKALRWQLGYSNWQNSERPLLEMLAAKRNCPLTSSCGRLFDAIAAQLGICSEISYEGQAAIRLEKEARLWLTENKPSPPYSEAPDVIKGLYELDSAALFAEAYKQQAFGRPTGEIAANFHYNLAYGLAQMAEIVARQLQITKIALSGGVMQNSLLSEILPVFLQDRSLEPLLHKYLPSGDGGLAFGQAAWGVQLLLANQGGHIPRNNRSIQGP